MSLDCNPSIEEEKSKEGKYSNIELKMIMSKHLPPKPVKKKKKKKELLGSCSFLLLL